jgi:chloramphenicol-sensitive protein RarD
VWLYGEPFTTAHAIAFGAIWAALALYVASLVHTMRNASRTAELTCG